MESVSRSPDLVWYQITFPLISLVSMENFGGSALLVKEEAKSEDVTNRQPEVEM